MDIYCEKDISKSSCNRIVIFHAGSLIKPLQEIAARYMEIHPDIEVILEASGSVDCVRKVVCYGHRADIIISADYTVFDTFMVPEHAHWYINFAMNEMVIAYSSNAKLLEKIPTTSWYDILLSDNVRFGRTHQDKDPAGYRALMVWQLAETYYKRTGLYKELNDKCISETIFDTAASMINALHEGAIDYAFEYLSVVRQNNMPYILLPPEINLSSTKYANFYRQARIISSGKEQVGVPIVNALTIPLTANNLQEAENFIKYMFSSVGQKVFIRNGQTMILPPEINDVCKLPVSLKNYQLK